MNNKHTSYNYRILTSAAELVGKTVIEVVDVGGVCAIITNNTIFMVESIFVGGIKLEELSEEEKQRLVEKTNISLTQIIS